MKAISLLCVFVLAKLLVLAGRDIPLSVWAPWAYFWQDILVALLFAALDYATRRWRWIGWAGYSLIVLYTAVNVPVACTLATPLTWPLLRAARGTLADSIAYHVTIANVVRLLAVLAAGSMLPFVVRRLIPLLSLRVRVAIVVGAAVCLPLGPMAAARLPTFGLDRNVLAVLATTALPRISALDMALDWRLSPFGNPRGEDLSRFRGRAAGRNVVVIHLESTGARYLRPYGAVHDPMPNLTRLAGQAILFENAYTVYPETIKSFFGVQCSLHPAMDTPSEIYGRDFVPALATVLRGQGYHTGLFHSGRFMYLGMDAVIRNRGYDTLEDAGAIGGEHDSSFGIDEPSAVRRILRWIDDVPAGQRFLVSYLPIAGHHPYTTPARGPFPESDDIDRYRNALHYADEALGQLLDGLRSRGLDRQTLFVILGDHGEAFGQHDGNFGHTLFVYEENVRVPFLIAAPGLTREPERVARVASVIDTAPTVLDLLDIAVPPGYEGRSLLGDQTRMALFCTDYSLGLLGLRDGKWKLIHELESGRSQLYDHQDDPNEQHDMAKMLPQRTQAYRDHLLGWAAAQKYRITKTP
jgi:glucan phosphoethanolaminetransferase (alkaline phosphatase superfamily)